MKASIRYPLLGASFAMLMPATIAWASVNHDLPPKQVHGSIVYRSGGSDPAQAAAMDSAESKYPLELDFLWGRGAKETPVKVSDWSIESPAGHALLEASPGGPVVLASIPDGRYTVTASYDGKSLTRTATVRNGAHDIVVLEWAQ
jgi:hypothetical protein